MCAKKKGNFAWWLVISFNFERRKLLLETVLWLLLMRVCLFSCSSIVTSSMRCSETCSTGVDKRLEFKVSFPFWCFWLVAVNTRFVLVGFNAIKFVQHLSETLLTLCWKSLSIVFVLSFGVLGVSSSANKPRFTDLGERHRDKSLMKMPDRRGA